MATGSTYLSATQVVVSGTNSSNLATDIMAFTIPSAGTWTVDYFVTMSSITGLAYAGIFNSSNGMLSDSQVTAPSAMNMSSATLNKTILITTIGAETFKIKGWQNGNGYIVYSGNAGVVYLADPVTIAKGDKGDQGIQGIQGIQGVVGPKGDRGDQGVQGIVGPKGDRGAIGLTGGNGPQGPAGPAGPQGAKGDTGAKGAIGATGPAGPRGTVNVTVQTRAPNSNEGVVGDIWYQI